MQTRRVLSRVNKRASVRPWAKGEDGEDRARACEKRAQGMQHRAAAAAAAGHSRNRKERRKRWWCS